MVSTQREYAYRINKAMRYLWCEMWDVSMKWTTVGTGFGVRCGMLH